MANEHLSISYDEYVNGYDSVDGPSDLDHERELVQSDAEAAGDKDSDEDEVEDGDEEPNPGEEIINVGTKHKGRSYDEMIQLNKNYIKWAVREYEKAPDDASDMILTLKDLFDRKKAWSEKKELKRPGSTPMWFGRHEGILIQDLEYSYVQWILNECAGGTEFADFHKFNRSKKSPGSIIIWFGQDKGRVPPDLGQLAWEMEMAYRARRVRRPPEIVNYCGRRLGSEDDGAASDVGSYISDDGFVVADEVETFNDDEGEDTEDPTEVYERNRSDVVESWEDGQRLAAYSDLEAAESDNDSLPSLEEVLRGGMASSSHPSKQSPPGASKATAISIDSEDDSEELIYSCKRGAPKSPSINKKRAVKDIDDGEESALVSAKDGADGLTKERSNKLYPSPPVTQETNIKNEDINAIESDSVIQLVSSSRRKSKNKTPKKSKARGKFDIDSSDSDMPLSLPHLRTPRKRAASVECTGSKTILTSPTKERARKKQFRGEGART
ncbi:hypothetical protein SBOR_9103 [Sclerotinia borealis F-4128]|uniref:Uncharacterized protein n=1 Tax=Sclerotinia borealis (strain F-4128) TaxID=1432307 RepID=W9C140_SCLBF|nr:hypothetical protein SBOR_9103 [Sclerotinia borealis F-4128]